MTENEAINTLQLNRPFVYSELQNALDIAIKALEKQIPKTVYHFVDDDTFETSCCGIDVSNEDFKYCPECGQLLGKVKEV